MAPQEPVVLRLPRLDHGEEPDFVLLHVSTAGNNPLDLNLIGTENITLFSVSCKVATRSTGAGQPQTSASCVNSGG